MKIAPYLQPGDQIALVAPARKVIHDEIAVAIRKMESAGYRVVYEEDLFAEFHQFAGEDPIRVATFQRYLDDPAIRMIWCVRGGYGSVRIIDQLDFTAFQKSPKWIAGFSDITVFHSHIHQLMGIPTLHCAMPVNILADDDDRFSFFIKNNKGKRCHTALILIRSIGQVWLTANWWAGISPFYTL